MKTLHLTNAYHPTSGGVRTFYRALLENAKRAGHQMRLVVPSHESRVEDLDENARIYHVRAPRSPLFDRRYHVLFPQHVLAPGSPVLRILRDEQPDLLEVCDKYSLCYLAGMIRKGWIAGVRRPVLVGLSCERMDDNVDSYLKLGGMGQRLAAFYMRRIYMPQFDHHLANSHYTAGELRRQARKHPRPVAILPMGVDLDWFGPGRRSGAVRQSLLRCIGGSATTRVLVYAGRVSPEKNVALLPHVLDDLVRNGGDYRLWVAGDGPLAAPLYAECATCTPGRAHFVRHMERDALANLLANADAFVHPNPREPFGIGPLEAMASGLPLVVPNAGGVVTYANEDNAWPALPTPACFAARVREIFADPETRSVKVGRALNAARQFRWDVVAPRFFSTYEQLVRSVTGSPLIVS